MKQVRLITATLACGLTALVLSACSHEVGGTPQAGPTVASGSPTGEPTGKPTKPKDILAGIDPCSLMGADAPRRLSVEKIGRDDEYQPTCVYQTPDTRFRLYAELVPLAELPGNPAGIGKLVDTTVGSTPAKIRRHPTNQACTVVLEAGRPTTAVFAVDTISGTQNESCELARTAAGLAAPVIRNGDFTQDKPAPSQDKDPCALLSDAQAHQLGVTLEGPRYGGCLYHYGDGNQLTISYESAAAASNPGTGPLTDTTIAGRPAKEKRQPHNTFCTYVLHPDQEPVVTVGAGGPPQFPQNQNCTLARRAATIVSGIID